ncbi:MAG TPA: hypothetical protein VIY53_18575 [Acidobacteriaceae bacterium]
MTPNCAFLLDNGQPCRCPALSGDLFCRHHTPEARARRLQPSPASSRRPQTPAESPHLDAPPPPAEMSAYWRILHRHIRLGDAESLDDTQTMILNALAGHAISHRSAGRLLALIADRHAQLQRDALEAQRYALHAQLQASNFLQPDLEPSNKCSVSIPCSQMASAEGSKSYSVSRQIHPCGSKSNLQLPASKVLCDCLLKSKKKMRETRRMPHANQLLA